jgi:hypothetical protein
MSIPNDQFEKHGFAPNFAICANKFLCAGKFFTSSLNSYNHGHFDDEPITIRSALARIRGEG